MTSVVAAVAVVVVVVIAVADVVVAFFGSSSFCLVVFWSSLPLVGSVVSPSLSAPAPDHGVHHGER